VPGGGNSNLQKRRASSKLSGHCSRPLVESQHDPFGATHPWDRGLEQPLEIEIRTIGDVKVIKLSGRITLGVAVDRLRDTFEDLINNGSNRLVLDLADVHMIDSSGIGLLVRYMRTAKQQDGAIKLLNPTKFAIQTLKMIGLLNMFEVFQDQDIAIGSFA
jgi:anti-sigma B factor antagonist